MSSHTPLGTTQLGNGTYRFDMATPSSPIPRTCSSLVSAFSTAGRGLTSPAYVTSVGACCTALSGTLVMVHGRRTGATRPSESWGMYVPTALFVPLSDRVFLSRVLQESRLSLLFNPGSSRSLTMPAQRRGSDYLLDSIFCSSLLDRTLKPLIVFA